MEVKEEDVDKEMKQSEQNQQNGENKENEQNNLNNQDEQNEPNEKNIENEEKEEKENKDENDEKEEKDEKRKKEENEDSEFLNEYQYFRLLFSDEIVDLLVEESNNYMKKIILEEFGPDYKNIVLTKKSHNTYPYLYVSRGIKREDILAFIGMRMYMGLHKYPKVDLYWNDNIIYKNLINRVMPKNYFFLLSKALHFPEKEEREEDTSCSKDEDKSEISFRVDPRQKINLYLEKLAKNFQKYYILGKNITIDESLLQFKGRNSMKFYIPMKPHKWGFKIHLLGFIGI